GAGASEGHSRSLPDPSMTRTEQQPAEVTASNHEFPTQSREPMPDSSASKTIEVPAASPASPARHIMHGNVCSLFVPCSDFVDAEAPQGAHKCFPRPSAWRFWHGFAVRSAGADGPRSVRPEGESGRRDCGLGKKAGALTPSMDIQRRGNA